VIQPDPYTASITAAPSGIRRSKESKSEYPKPCITGVEKDEKTAFGMEVAPTMNEFDQQLKSLKASHI
jgi:hypothetical protein